MSQQLVRDLLDAGFDRICRIDSTDNNEPVKGTLAVTDTCALEVRYDREVLPYLTLQTVLLELFTQDRITLTDCLKTFSGDRTGCANSQSRARERLTVYHVVGKTESLTYNSYFILVEEFYRFYQLHLHLFGKTADIVMCLNTLFTLQNIRIDGTLSKETNPFQLSGFFIEYLDELFTDDMSLLFRIGYSCNLVNKSVCRIDIDQISVHLVSEYFDDLFGFTFSQETVVNMNTYQILADRLDQ